MSVGAERREDLPVFLFPATLSFVASDPASHKQLLTLYNPYDFPIQYSVLSTAPNKYSVLDPQGTLRPKCCIDIVIRHLSVGRASVGVGDRFRVQISERGRRSSGRKDVPVVVSQTAPGESATAAAAAFQGATTASGERRSGAGSQYAFSSRAPKEGGGGADGGGVAPLCVLSGLACVLALSLPSEGDATTSVPPYLHLTMPQKLVAAYVLGLITMLLIRR